MHVVGKDDLQQMRLFDSSDPAKNEKCAYGMSLIAPLRHFTKRRQCARGAAVTSDRPAKR